MYCKRFPLVCENNCGHEEIPREEVLISIAFLVDNWLLVTTTSLAWNRKLQTLLTYLRGSGK